MSVSRAPGGETLDRGQRLTLRFSFVLLLVVGLAVTVALTGVLWLSWRLELQRLDEGQLQTMKRSAEFAEALMRRRVDRGELLVSGLAESQPLGDALREHNSSRAFAAIRRLQDSLGSGHVVVYDERGLPFAWSSPLATLAFGRSGGGFAEDGHRIHADIVAGDLTALMSRPVYRSGRQIGLVRAAIPVGRLFLHELTEDLGQPVAIFLGSHLAHSSFPGETPLPAGTEVDRLLLQSGDLAGEHHDIGFMRVGSFDADEIWIGVAASRRHVVAARDGYLRLIATFGIGGFVLVVFTVGAFLAFSMRRELKLKRQRDAAVSRSRGLSDRLAHLTAVVHDIKAPLGGIQLRCEGLAEDQDEPETREALGQVVETCERLSLYLVNVLTAAQAEEGPIRLNRHVLLAAGLLEDVAESLESLAARRGVHLATEADSELAPLEGDGVLIERALLNLAANALTAVPRGGTVTLFAESRDGKLSLGVRDDGPGFVDFDPAAAFSRSRVTVKDSSIKAGSTGLGLFIVARIAEAHGGRARATNLDRGAEVALELPL